jgi:hypothetical protein
MPTYTSDPKEFAAQVQAAINGLNNQMTQAFRKVCVDLSSKLIRQTPVETGRCRANWWPSIDTPIQRADWDRFSPDGSSQVAEVEQVVGELQLGQRYVITNSLPYVESLNEGHSRQAPAGFVQALVSEAEHTASAAFAEVARGVRGAAGSSDKSTA